MKKRLNWVDWFLIALVVLLVAGTVVKFAVLDPNARNGERVRIAYDLKVAGVRSYTVDAFQVGDALFGETGKGQVGTITDIQVSDALRTTELSDGTVDQLPMEDRYDILLTVTADAVKSSEGYKVDEYQIMFNQSALYYTKYAAFYANTVEIRENP